MRTDLAFGKNVFTEGFVPSAKSYGKYENNTGISITDGTVGDPEKPYGGGWLHFYRGVGRRISIDLGEVCEVEGIEISFIHARNMGIYCPERVDMLVSENGMDYYRAGSIAAPYPASFGETARAVYRFSAQKPIAARYVAAEFFVEVHAFCGNFRVYGSTESGIDLTPAALCGETVTPIPDKGFCPREALGGVYDIPLIYYGNPKYDHLITAESLLPYVGYIKDGVIADRMFDGLIFLPAQGSCPSGASAYYGGGVSTLDDAYAVADAFFAPDGCLNSLASAVARVNDALGGEKPFPVYLTAPVPQCSADDYGDINGDGISEKLLTTEDRVAAYRLFVDTVTARFAAEAPDTVRLGGFFWATESLSREYADEEVIFAEECVKYLHSRGLKCIFIPYYQAGGCEKALDVGFDAVTMQPNLTFNDTLATDPCGAMEDFTDICRKMGFGAEVEIHQGVKNPKTAEKYLALFYEYLRACIKTGMMCETVHTYYQVATPGVFSDCAYSAEPSLRRVYDMLYRFVRGTLTVSELDGTPEDANPETEIKAETANSEPERESEPETENAAAPEPEAPARGGESPEEWEKRPAAPTRKKHGGAHPRGIDKKKAALALAGAAAAVYIIGRMLKGRK